MQVLKKQAISKLDTTVAVWSQSLLWCIALKLSIISSIFFILLHSADLRGIAHKTQKIWLLGAMLKRNLIAWNFLHFPFLPYQLQPHYKEISRILFLLLLSSCFLIPFVCCFWGDAWKILELWKYFCVIYKKAKIEWVQLKYPCLVKTSQRNE